MFRFSEVLEKAFVLALFLPMVVAAGGNSGGQAATMVIRAMALGEISTGNALRIAWKEARTGLFLGLVARHGDRRVHHAGPAAPPRARAAFRFPAPRFAVAAAITVQVLSATVLGALLPICAAPSSSTPPWFPRPSLASTVDVSGMLIYFTIAGSILPAAP
jgi:magnesium transporter